MDKATFEDQAVRAFAVNAAAYLTVTLICAGINLWLAPQRLWFVWVLAGWGIAVATHGFALYLNRSRRGARLFSGRKTRGFAVHAFAYVAVIMLLLIVNATKTPHLSWALWVALGWGAGLALHAWLVFGRRRRARS